MKWTRGVYLDFLEHISGGFADEGQRGHPEVSLGSIHITIDHHGAHDANGSRGAQSRKCVLEELPVGQTKIKTIENEPTTPCY